MMMTYHLAIRILDRIKDGATYSREIIDAALRATGDLETPLY